MKLVYQVKLCCTTDSTETLNLSFDHIDFDNSDAFSGAISDQIAMTKSVMPDVEIRVENGMLSFNKCTRPSH